MATSTAGKFSGFLIAAAQSGSGKTTVTLGLLRALKKRGVLIQPFKCGPDYIDPGFHRIASGKESINLDTWMMGEDGVSSVWSRHVQGADVAVVEGVMGLFDGRKPGNLEGSSADVSRILNLPVILVVDAKGMAGSIAPIVAGYANFHPEVKVAGVIANRVGSSRHAELLRESLELADLPPLVGYLPRDDRFIFPERHLGLVPQLESMKDTEKLDVLAEIVEECFDLELLLNLTRINQSQPDCNSNDCASLDIETRHALSLQPEFNVGNKTCRVAVAYDAPFHFYYHENFRRLKEAGCELIRFSPLNDTQLPEADWVYLGGGFPEIFAEQLEQNSSMRNSIKTFAENGGTIFAECGGYVYLGNSVIVDGKRFEMCGVIDGDSELFDKRQALGYRTAELLCDLPMATSGTEIRGHEFHYTAMKLNNSYDSLYKITDSRGNSSLQGVRYKNVFAGYPHLMW